VSVPGEGHEDVRDGEKGNRAHGADVPFG
jgi:hypothetical protein